MEFYPFAKALHIVSSTILFGTGLGTAFFQYRSRLTTDLHARHLVTSTTVKADFLFTAPSGLIQPLSGIWLIVVAGYDWNEPWLVVSYGLYVLAGLCWLPVVWIQLELKRLLDVALRTNSPLPARYDQLFRLWFWLGWPAFLSLIMVFYLMAAKPTW
ncbi:MAG: DUF2269 domain-containing protein [Proteobacteria bacterium]|nr:MAG: DUF2269 domain-containing protein [Pseudomonadota bacterium]